MFQNRKMGPALIIQGVLAINYVYLHNLIFGTYQYYEPGAIDLGWLATIPFIASLAVTALGLVIVMRSYTPAANA